MTKESRVAQLAETLREVTALGGQRERTRIITNLEVIDATGGAAGTAYIITEDENGFYAPALKVPGAAYSNGDLVNVLIVEGSEPVAFQQGSGSSETDPVTVSKLVSPDRTIDPVMSADNSGDVTIAGTGDLYLPDNIVHVGDTDTFINFAANIMTHQAGGIEGLAISSTSVVVNEDGENLDFRVEGDTLPNLLTVDAGNDQIYVNNTSAAAGEILRLTKATTDHTTSQVCLNAEQTSTLSGALVGSHRVLSFIGTLAGSGGGAGSVFGIIGDIFNAQTSGTLAIVDGVAGVVRVTGGGTITTARGLRVQPVLTSTGGMTAWRGVSSNSPSVSGAGGITTAYGVYIERQKIASGVTTGYGVYQADSNDVNYFAGNTGIGTAPSGSYSLDAGGQIHATSFPTSSDRRLKRRLTPLGAVLDKLDQITPVAFNWNSLHAREMKRSDPYRRELGLIAQEVRVQFPELITEWDYGRERFLAMDYGRFTAVLLKAIQELKAEIDILKGV